MKQRVLTALALIPPVLLALFLRSIWPLAALAAVALLIAFAELRAVLRRPGFPVPILGSALLVFAGLPWAGWFTVGSIGAFAGLAGGTLVGGVAAWKAESLGKFGPELAAMWIACPLAALCRLHGDSPGAFDWATPLTLAILPIWAGDTAAIFAGKAFGKHLLAPSISPKKTIEGAIANLVFCAVAAWAIGSALHLGVGPSLSVGLAIGVFGQIGDLFQSALKRRVGAKDSGGLLPGHGGVLDRIDSLLFAAPVACLILAIASRG